MSRNGSDRSSGLRLNGYGFRMRSLGEFNGQDARLQGRASFAGIDFRGQIDSSQYPVRAPFGAKRLAFFLLFMSFAFAGNPQSAWLDGDFEILRIEAGDFCFHRKAILGLSQ